MDNRSHPSELTRSLFDSLSWTELNDYANAIEDGNFPLPKEYVVQELMSDIHAYDPYRQMCIIRWGIQLQLLGIEDVAVDFYQKEQDQGAQYTILMWLEQATGLTSDHIEQIARTPTRISEKHLAERLTRLRAVAGRQH